MPPQEGQEPPALVPVVVDGYEWEIDEILEAKLDTVGFQVLWRKGDQTTEPARHLNHLATLIIMSIDINISQFTLCTVNFADSSVSDLYSVASW